MNKKIGIIIPVRNLSWMTINFLESLKANSDINKYRIYLIDNGSSAKEGKAVSDWLDKNAPNFEITVSKKALGFVKAVNIGIKRVMEDKLEYFFIFNNDTFVTAGWDDNLLESLKRDDVAIVGPMTSPPDWRDIPMAVTMIKDKIKYSQVAQALEGYSSHLKKAFRGHYEKEVDFLAFYCVGLKTSVIQSLGMLDERFGMGLYDDDDYCYRIEKAGYKIMLRKDVYVHHYHRSTWIEHEIEYQELLKKNLEIFVDKWGFDPWERRKAKKAK